MFVHRVEREATFCLWVLEVLEGRRGAGGVGFGVCRGRGTLNMVFGVFSLDFVVFGSALIAKFVGFCRFFL